MRYTRDTYTRYSPGYSRVSGVKIHIRYVIDTDYDTYGRYRLRYKQIHTRIHTIHCIEIRYMLTLVSHLGYEIFRSAGRELYRCVYRACIVRTCAESRSLPIRIDTLRYIHDTLPIRLWGKRTPIHGENGTPSKR